jgi:hypothetical protein
MGTAASCCAMSSTRRTRVSPSPQGWTASSPSAPARAATRAPRAPSPSRGRFANSGTASSCSGAPSATATRCAPRRCSAPTSRTWARASSPPRRARPRPSTSRCSSTAASTTSCTPIGFSGVHANFLKPSIVRHGIDVATLPPKAPDVSSLAGTDAKAWKDIWSAGQGLATIHDIPPVAELVARLRAEYDRACAAGVSPALRR